MFSAAVRILLFMLLLSTAVAASAQDETETFFVLAGYANAGDSVEVMAFSPATLQVHRGDRVRWLLNGVHNVHFHDAPTLFYQPIDTNGETSILFNPEVMLPTIESGASYTGGQTNSGLPLGPGSEPWFEVVMDVEPGTYVYWCDVHPGMTGVIEVVDDSVEISSPADALSAGFTDIGIMIRAGIMLDDTLQQQAQAQQTEPTEGGAQIAVGAAEGQTVTSNLYPAVVVIRPGESVTWTMVDSPIAPPVGIRSEPGPTQGDLYFFEMPADGGMPRSGLTTLFVNGSLPSGSEVGAGDSWFTGWLKAGESFTLTFTEPGVYRFSDSSFLSEGAVVVMP
jgi:plastocyanin